MAESADSAMTAAERLKLLDAAMKSHDAASYLDGVQRAFEDRGRSGDAVVAAVLCVLIQAGEIETVMHMRAEWSGRGKAGQTHHPSGL